MPEPELGETTAKVLPRVGEGWRRGREGASQERLRALPSRPSVSAALLRPAARLAPRPAGRLRAARVHCRPAQPTRRPSARRARADRGSSSARSEGEGRGTRNEARGTRHEARGVTKCRHSASGGRAVKEWCCWMRGARACRMGARHGSLRLRMFEESRTSSGIAPAMLQCVEMRNQAAWS